MWFLPCNRSAVRPANEIGNIGADRIGSSRGRRDAAAPAVAKRGFSTASATHCEDRPVTPILHEPPLLRRSQLRSSTGFQVEERFRISGQHLASMRIVEIDLIDDIQRFVDRTEWRISGKDNSISTKEL